MSTTDIYRFNKEGYAQYYDCSQNSWRHAMAVWGILEEKYLPPYIPNFAKGIGITTVEEFERRNGYKPCRICAPLDEKSYEEIWDLVDNDAVSEVDKICLYTTLDDCLIRKEEIPRVVAAFRKFEGETSLGEQADILEALYKEEDCIAVGFSTSIISRWLYYREGENNDEETYNCLTGKEHYWLFDEIKGE